MYVWKLKICIKQFTNLPPQCVPGIGGGEERKRRMCMRRVESTKKPFTPS
ncbi:hypothetical protein HanIR_Chr14g0686791 [Helianthus annuus]|nr:hypothetical protein HanIR_Chr14g0686791 [Helianthus annuus]